MELSLFTTRGFSRGRPAIVEAIWILLQALLVSSSIPGSWYRRLLLRAFGARIGRRAVLKPRMRVKFPWRLRMGDDVWIGEGVWIDNLADIIIGSNCCISQDAYLCTGSHNWASREFDLVVKPIMVNDHAWICARAILGPGVTVGAGATLSLGSVATRDLEEWTIYHGNPAQPLRKRSIRATA